MGLGAVPKTPLQKFLQAHQNLAPNSSGTVAEPTVASNPRTTKVVVSDGQQRQNQSTPRSGATQSPNLTTIMQRQTDLADLLLMQQRQSSLPQREVPVFDGDPLNFRLFTQAFKHNIEDKTDCDEDRLYFLEQYTTGQPRELVRSCFHMNATTGYAEAKRLLKDHFDDDFKITTAYIEKALNWHSIQTDDGQALHSYALYLRSCSNAVQGLPYITELDLPSNMKQLVSKLPFKLREKWRSIVDDIIERTNRVKGHWACRAVVAKITAVLLISGSLSESASGT